MPIFSIPRSIVILITMFSMGLMLASCSERIEDSAAYQAACHGPPLRTTENRYKAEADNGYAINFAYDCIDKASFVAENERRAQVAADNTPEAIAKREVEFEEKKARYAEQREREREAEASQAAEAQPTIVLRDVDVNAATEEDIANVISIGPIVAAQIIEERTKRRFNDWADLVHRVIGLGAAQTAYYASICGLNVDGKSLDGAPPNATIATSIHRKYQQYQKN